MMDIELLYWHWVVFGLVLLAIEILLPTFTLFWFGCGALVVGITLIFAPNLYTEEQFILWGVLSSIFTIAWFVFLKPKFKDRTKAGLTREAVVGQIGIVIEPPSSGKKGTVRFTVPVLGDEEWQFVADDTLEKGEKVSVVDVLGNTFKVQKMEENNV